MITVEVRALEARGRASVLLFAPPSRRRRVGSHPGSDPGAVCLCGAFLEGCAACGVLRCIACDQYTSDDC